MAAWRHADTRELDQLRTSSYCSRTGTQPGCAASKCRSRCRELHPNSPATGVIHLNGYAIVTLIDVVGESPTADA